MLLVLQCADFQLQSARENVENRLAIDEVKTVDQLKRSLDTDGDEDVSPVKDEPESLTDPSHMVADEWFWQYRA